MQKTSSIYQKEMQQHIIGQAYVRIKFGLIDTDAATTATITSSAQASYSNTESMLSGGVPLTTYATAEPGRMIVGSSQRILPKASQLQMPEGLISAELCDKNGIFQNPPFLHLKFSKIHTVPALTLSFDTHCSDYAAEIYLEAFCEGKPILSETYYPENAMYITPNPIERFDELKINFIKMNTGFRRLRLQSLMFGLGMTFENRQVNSSVQHMEVDPITRRLPTNTFSFTLLNISGFSGASQQIYDPDNPKGIWKYIDQQSPVTVEYGRYLTSARTWGDVYSGTWGDLEENKWCEIKNGGVIEWINGGRYFLTSTPVVNGITATFKTHDILTGMNEKYLKGVFQRQSLYELAEAVLLDANLPKRYDGSNPWLLSDALKSIFTEAPAPNKKHKELLQLIAHAACCVLYVSREGVIHIEPLNQQQNSFKLDFSSAYKPPRVTKTATLKGVECTVFQYSVDEKNLTLHDATYFVDASKTIEISYPAASNIEAEVVGATILSSQFFSERAIITLQGNGQAQVILSGNKISNSSFAVTELVQSPDVNSGMEILNNPLITHVDTAVNCARWVMNYLQLRNTYEFEYRGRPELEPMDKIFLQSQFDNNFSAVVLRNEINFSGGINGKVLAKRVTE